MIEFQGVTKKYRYSDTFVFDGFSALLPDVATLVLDIQSGKTTLAKLVCGLEKPSGGIILFDGKDLSTLSARQKDISLVSRDLLLFENKTVLKNIAFPLVIRKDPLAKVKAKSVAEATGVANRLGVKAKKLTFDERFRVVLARLILRNPKLVVIDSLCEILNQDQTALLCQTLVDLKVKVLNLTSNDTAIGERFLVCDSKVIAVGNEVDQCKKQLLWLYDEQN